MFCLFYLSQNPFQQQKVLTVNTLVLLTNLQLLHALGSSAQRLIGRRVKAKGNSEDGLQFVSSLAPPRDQRWCLGVNAYAARWGLGAKWVEYCPFIP